MIQNYETEAYTINQLCVIFSLFLLAFLSIISNLSPFKFFLAVLLSR